jgi:hypothetical protein
MLMPLACHGGLSFQKEKEIGRRERRTGKESIVYRVGIRMDFIAKIKTPRHSA